MSSSSSIPPHPFPAWQSGLNRTELPPCAAARRASAGPGARGSGRGGRGADSCAGVAPVSFGKLWCESFRLGITPPRALPSIRLPNKMRRHRRHASCKAACAVSPPPQGFAPTETVGAECACMYILHRSRDKNNREAGSQAGKSPGRAAERQGWRPVRPPEVAGTHPELDDLSAG